MARGYTNRDGYYMGWVSSHNDYLRFRTRDDYIEFLERDKERKAGRINDLGSDIDYLLNHAFDFNGYHK